MLLRDRPLLFLDTETTGLNTDTDRIIEVGLIGFPEGITKPCEKYSAFVHPKQPIPSEASRVHRIFDDHVVSAPTWDVVGEMVQQVIRKYTSMGGLVVAYNGVHYDMPIMASENTRHGIVTEPSLVFDPMIFCAWWFQKLPQTKLENVAAAMNLEPGPAHRAIGDCITTAKIVRRAVLSNWLPNSLDDLFAQQSILREYNDLLHHVYGHSLVYKTSGTKEVLVHRYTNTVIGVPLSEDQRKSLYSAMKRADKLSDVAMKNIMEIYNTNGGHLYCKDTESAVQQLRTVYAAALLAMASNATVDATKVHDEEPNVSVVAV